VKGEHATSETQPDLKTTSESAPPRARGGKRRSAQRPSSSGTARFFLSKSDSNGIPNLDREFDNESEAIVESLKTGKSYFVISEWKGLADVSKKIPLIRKEAVSNKKHNLE
jgi:hypothetical protein